MKLNRIIRDGKSKADGNAFVNKNFEGKEPEVVVKKEPITEVKETITDNFQYNHPVQTKLSDLSNNTNESSKEESKNP